MKRKGVVALVVVFGVIITATFFATPSENDVTILFVTPKSFGNRPPNCVMRNAQGDCTWPLIHRADVHIRQPGLAIADIYTKHPKTGVTYRARVVRVPIGTNWVWLFRGGFIWKKALQRAKSLMADAAGVIGPKEVSWITTRPQAQCVAISEALLVQATTDAGTLRQPNPITRRICVEPLDGGVSPDTCHLETKERLWPDGGFAFQCGSAGFYLQKSKHGLGIAKPWPVETDAGQSGPSVAPVPPKDKLSDFDEPPAPTTKTCFNVPVETACPTE